MTRALKLYQGVFGRVCLVDSDRGLVTHAHPQCHVLIKAGGADTSYQVHGKTHRLDAQSMVLINAWEPHAKIHLAADGCSVVLALFIEPKWLAEIRPGLPACDAPGFFPSSCVALPAAIRTLADRLLTEMPGPDDDRRLHAQWEEVLSALMIAIVESFSAPREEAASGACRSRRIIDPRIARAISFMERHLGESFTSEQLARMHCLSRPHFFSLFKECTALSPALYMNTLRMEAALGGLAREGVSISQLSDTLGFSEPNHFTRFFRHNLGIPPTEYRRAVTVVGEKGRASPPA